MNICLRARKIKAARIKSAKEIPLNKLIERYKTVDSVNCIMLNSK